MPAHLPTPYELSLRNLLFNPSLFSLQTKLLNQDILRFNTYFKTSDDFKSELNNPTFWQQEELKPWQIEWEKLAPLAHLNTQALIDLWLEMPVLINNHKIMLKQYALDVPFKAHLESNINHLEIIKKSLKHALLMQAKSYEILDAHSSVADRVAAFVVRFKNAFPKLALEVKPHGNISEDQRLLIHALLRSEQEEGDALESLLAPLDTQGYLLSHYQLQAPNRFEEYRNFFNEKEISLGIKKNFFQKTEKEFWKQLLGIFPNYILSHLPNFKKFKWLIYFSLSFLSFLALQQALSLTLSWLVSASVLTALNTALFMGVALFPIWWQLGNSSTELVNDFKNLILQNRYQQTFNALDHIRQTQQFIETFLSAPLLDIPHLDCKWLHKKIKQSQKLSDIYLHDLNHLPRWQKWLFGHKHIKVSTDVIEKIQQQKIVLKTRIEETLSQLSRDIHDQMDKLIKLYRHDPVKPILTKQKLNDLKVLLNHHASSQTQQLFIQSTHLVAKWVAILANNPLRSSQILHYHQPWGGQDINFELIRAFEVVSHELLENPLLPEVNKLISLLRGQINLSVDEYKTLTDNLKLTSDEQMQLSHFLFTTLHQRPLMQVKLLNETHQNVIDDWFEQNKEKMQAVYQSGGNKNSNLYVEELLEGKNIYQALHQTMTVAEQNEKIKQLIETSPEKVKLISRHLRGLSPADKQKLMPQFLQRRFNYLLNQAFEGQVQSLTSTDVEYLTHRDVIKSNFNLENFITGNKIYNSPSSPRSKLAPFLEECAVEGLLSKQTVEHYQLKQLRVQKFHQCSDSPTSFERKREKNYGIS